MDIETLRRAFTLACMELQRGYLGGEKEEWSVMQWEEYLINEAKQSRSEEVSSADLFVD